MSCFDGFLKLYSIMLEARIQQFGNNESSTPNNPFKQLRHTMSAHTILPDPSYRESSYGLGWIRTQLPNQMCKISSNVGMLGGAPVAGEGAPPKLIIANYGSMTGSFSGVNTFPESESTIVVLINSTPRYDLADWMTQLLTQTPFDIPEKSAYLNLVRNTVDAELRRHHQTSKQIRSICKKEPTPGDLDGYVGHYYNVAKTFSIEVRRDGNRLLLASEGRDDEVFPMEYCHDRVFSWLQSRDDLVKRARIVGQGPLYYLIRFEMGENKINRLFWAHDSQLPEREIYQRQKD